MDEILQYIDKFLDSMNAEADGRYIFMRYSHFLLFWIQLNSFHFPFSANFNPVLGVRLKYINEPLRQGSQDSEDKATQTEEEAKPSQEENKAKKKIKKTIEWVRL